MLTINIVIRFGAHAAPPMTHSEKAGDCMNAPTPQERALLNAVFRLRRANFSLLFCRLTRAEFFVLEYIHNAGPTGRPDAGGIYVSELAAALRISPPAVSRTLGPLEDRGLIERHVDRADRRNTRIFLTPEGEQTRCEAAGRMQRFSETFVHRRGASDIDTLTRLLEKFVDIWEEELTKENNRC